MLNPQFSGGFELDMNRFINPSTPLSLVIVYFLWILLVCSILVGSRLSLSFGSLCDLTFDYLIPLFSKYKHLIHIIFIVRLIVSPDKITCKKNQSEHLGRYRASNLSLLNEMDKLTSCKPPHHGQGAVLRGKDK